MLLELAKQKNSTPLPPLKGGSGLRLPPDRYCLTQPNYQLQFYKRAIASSASQVSSSTRLPGSANVFKTPTAPAKSAPASGGSQSTPSGATFRILSGSGMEESNISFKHAGM